VTAPGEEHRREDPRYSFAWVGVEDRRHSAV
jgi:hypothetical protein